MGDENPIRTLGDYSRPNHEGYRNTIKLPDGNNVVPLRSDTIRLVQNGCSFHGLRSEDPNQHLKDFIKLMDSLDLDVANRERTQLRLFHFPIGDKASNWLEHLPAGSISTWEDLTTRNRACRDMKEVEEVGEWMEYEEPLNLVDTNEESIYESLIEKMPSCSLNFDFRIGKGDPSNLRIMCMIGRKFITNAYIDLDSPMNVMSLACYNAIRNHGYEFKGQNFIGIGRDMHVFVRNMSHVMDFTILEKIKANIDPSLSHVKVTFKTPYRDSEMDDLTSDEHDLLSSRVILSEDYYRRGCERASNIESGFYMNVDKLGPSYKEETNILMRHLKLMEI
ncbi:hypothetical protein Tco_0096636 [Tanacetum coccineum]